MKQKNIPRMLNKICNLLQYTFKTMATQTNLSRIFLSLRLQVKSYEHNVTGSALHAFIKLVNHQLEL